MKYLKHFTYYFLVLAYWGLSQGVLAENKTQIDGYTIHYAAITTNYLTPEIAKLYKIRRSNTRGMVTISVLKDQPEATGVPVRAKVTVHATNLNNQMRSIAVKEVIEGMAVYYIGDFGIRNAEDLTFQLEITPEGTEKILKASFKQEFFVD